MRDGISHRAEPAHRDLEIGLVPEDPGEGLDPIVVPAYERLEVHEVGIVDQRIDVAGLVSILLLAALPFVAQFPWYARSYPRGSSDAAEF